MQPGPQHGQDGRLCPEGRWAPPLQRAVPGAAWGSPEPCGHLIRSPQILREAHGAEETSGLASRSRFLLQLCCGGAGLRCTLLGEALAPFVQIPPGGLCCPPLSGARPQLWVWAIRHAMQRSFPAAKQHWVAPGSLGPQVGDLLAFQPSLGAGQGPRVLFCEVSSRWRRGPLQPACPCAERWFLSCRPAFRGGENLQRERRESLLTSLRPFFLSPSLPQAQKITE